MARNHATVKISKDDRDNGKVFYLTEMPAMQIEQWATKVLLGAIKGGAVIPEGIENQGLAGLVYVGLNAVAKLDYDMAAPLLREMLECAEIVPDPVARPDYRRSDIASDIEEVSTIITLREAIFELHTGFSLAAAFSKSKATA
jgi:hypothetical protein